MSGFQPTRDRCRRRPRPAAAYINEYRLLFRPDQRGGDAVRRCLVTGGAGFIGSHLVAELLNRGDRVRVLDDFSTGKAANLERLASAVEVLHGGITDGPLVRAAVADCEVVFHLAALPSVARSVEEPLASHDACATGTVQVLDAARLAKVRRVVYAASSSAYGDIEGA